MTPFLRSIRFTTPGKLFSALFVVFYFAALTSQSSLLLSLIGIFGACYAMNLWKARRALKDLELLPISNTLLAEGEKSHQPWVIANRGSVPACLVSLEIASSRIGLPLIPAQSEATFLPDLAFARRGLYPLWNARAVSSYPFGLVEVSRPLRAKGEIAVYPALFATVPPAAAGFETVVGGKIKGARRLSSGAHFAGIRPIQPGDPLKQIHWKGSARTGQLMVKTFEEELSGKVSFIVDCGHSGSAEQLDNCLRAAGSLAMASLEAGHQIEWLDLAHPQPLPVAPFSQADELLHRLASISVKPGCLNTAELENALARTSRKSGIALVLTQWTPAVAAALAPLVGSRPISVYLPASEPAPERPANAPAGTGRPAGFGLAMYLYTAREMEMLQ